MSESGVEVWRSSVAVWECDRMGHLNVRFYVARAMEALVGLTAELGMPRAFSTAAESTLVLRDMHIRFVREARPGARLSITGGVVEMGETDARLLLVMHHDSGEIAAGFQLVVSHVTVRDLRPFPWPQRVRDRAEGLRMEIPERARPRSVSMDTPIGEASLERALALGMTMIAQGAVQPQDCDPFGRMRADQFMARISDGIARLGATELDPTDEGAAHRGGAALEYRLAHLGWPRAGDRVALYSGLAGVETRIRRYVHWLLDPGTGQAWGVAQSTGVSLDLKTRKLIEQTPEKLERFRAFVIPGLAF